MPPSKKNDDSHIANSDSDSDSDEEFLFSDRFVFSSKRKENGGRNDNCPDAKKKRLKEKMNSLLQESNAQVKREIRMDQIHQRDSILLQEEECPLDKKKIDNNENSSSHINAVNGRNMISPSLLQTQNKKINHYYNKQPKDSKESQCYGSRNTLQFSRLISPVTDGTSPYWLNFEEALTHLRIILINDRQQSDTISNSSSSPLSSSFALLREKLLQSTVTMCPNACSAYLKKERLCDERDQERIKYLPVDLLRWLVTLACGPIMMTQDKIVYDNNGIAVGLQNEKENNQKSEDPSQKEANCDSLDSLWPLVEAQTGAYLTLCRLWSQESGYPLQMHNQQDCDLFSVSALPVLLRQWFGLTLPSVTTGEGECEEGAETIESSLSLVTAMFPLDENSIDNKKDQIQIRTTRTALIRFLRLWALALQQQINTNNETNVHLIRYDYEKGHCKEFREDVANAILAVLWAGLDPIFASSKSAFRDGKRYIQTIIECLLDMVRRKDNPNSACYDQWLYNLSEQIFELWSKQLGRGQRGTDAYEDHCAWLSLSQTVDRLVYDDEDDDSVNGNDNIKKTERKSTSSLVGLQLKLSHCIINRAFDDDQDVHKAQNYMKEKGRKIKHNFGNNDDWVSQLVDEEMNILKCSSWSWQAIALASIGLNKLATLFPEDYGSKCFAVLDICTVCFHISVVDLQSKIQYRRLKENREYDSVENGVDHIPMDSRSSTEDAHSERYALYATFERLEEISECLSQKTRGLIMQNICFPWASHMAESLRNYARLRKGPFAPPSEKNMIGAKKHQTKLDAFLQNNQVNK